MRLNWNVGKRHKGDSRFTFLRVESDYYAYGCGWKVSLSVQPKVYFKSYTFKDFRLTLLGLNVHLKWN